MNATPSLAAKSARANLGGLLPDLQALYKDLHAHPELSMQEKRTAGLAAERLRTGGYEVAIEIGKTGVVGLLRNGTGPTVMLRAGMGCAARRGGYRCVLRGQGQSHGQRGEVGAGDACLRPRYARHLARRRNYIAGTGAHRVARYADGGRGDWVPGPGHSRTAGHVLHIQHVATTIAGSLLCFALLPSSHLPGFKLKA